MSRLEEIAKRNAGASRWSLKQNFAFGLRSLFLLVILGLLLFTSWALPPKDMRPGVNIVPDKTYRPTSGGTLLMRPATPDQVPERP